MKLIELVSASDSDSFYSALSCEDITKRLLEFRPRGFLTDFIDFPHVAKEKRGKVVISHKPSWFTFIGLRSVFRIKDLNEEREVRVRILHSIIDTLFLTLIFAFSAIALLICLMAAIIEREVFVVFFGIVASGIFFVGGAFANAWIRVIRKRQLDSMKSLISKIKEEISNQAAHTTPAIAPR